MFDYDPDGSLMIFSKGVMGPKNQLCQIILVSHVRGSPFGGASKKGRTDVCKAVHNISVKPSGVEKKDWNKLYFCFNISHQAHNFDLDLLLVVFVAKKPASQNDQTATARIPRAEIPPFTPVGREACHLMKVDGWNFEG